MSHRYLATAEALRFLPANRAYLDDGERCTARPNGTTSLMAMQGDAADVPNAEPGGICVPGKCARQRAG